MLQLTRAQYEESVDRFYHNSPFDHLLLDERTPEGNIVTVLRYDEETILMQTIENGDLNIYKISNADFLRNANQICDAEELN